MLQEQPKKMAKRQKKKKREGTSATGRTIGPGSPSKPAAWRGLSMSAGVDEAVLWAATEGWDFSITKKA